MNPIDPHSHNEIRPAEEIRTESFNAWDPAITQQIDALVAKAAEAARSDGDPDTTDLAREIIVK
jgi:hypothetical protein